MQTAVLLLVQARCLQTMQLSAGQLQPGLCVHADTHSETANQVEQGGQLADQCGCEQRCALALVGRRAEQEQENREVQKDAVGPMR